MKLGNIKTFGLTAISEACGLTNSKIIFALLYTNLTVNIRNKHRTKRLLNKGVQRNEKEDKYKFSEASKKLISQILTICI